MSVYHDCFTANERRALEVCEWMRDYLSPLTANPVLLGLRQRIEGAIEGAVIDSDVEHQQVLVRTWSEVPVGTEVVVTRDVGQEPRELRTRTRSAAQLLGGHTAVIWIEGISGAYALERVRIACRVEVGAPIGGQCLQLDTSP